jgi:3-hydroxyacyl-CoA dehydrogenase/enoyl-CoA hydratase/3-hydroxybutyryl-CoA epimerase
MNTASAEPSTAGPHTLLVSEIGRLTLDPRGIARLTLEMPGRANKINVAFLSGLTALFDRALAEPGLRGLVLTSGHKDFCVGADLDMIFGETDPARVFAATRALGALLRRIETAPFPVAAALTGSAHGGGYELALATHHRVILEQARVTVGLPEVQLGLIPGGGGTQRLPRLIGLQPAVELIAQAKLTRGHKAVAAGLADAGAATPEAVVEAACAWVLAHPGARQPWDQDDFHFPGLQPSEDAARNLFMAGAALLYKKTAGVYPAPEAAMAVIQEGARLRFDRALEVEARAFVRLAVGGPSKDMIRTLWFHKNAAERLDGLPTLPAGVEAGIRTVGVLGAGMMGGGLAFVAAKAGYSVVLRDIRREALELAMTHIRGQVAERLRHLDGAAQAALLARVHTTLDLADLSHCDLIIEAVVEDKAVKHAVLRELEPALAPGAIWASNTSALPITELAEPSGRREDVVGLHFFSPVEQMPLVEIIRTAASSERTLARVVQFVRTLEKLPILVGDGYGFFTTRVFASYILEGVQMVAEGHDPARVEWAARISGMVVPPLQVFDEVSLRLGRHVLDQAEAYTGRVLPAAKALLVALVDEEHRLGRQGGAGFYRYTDGRREGIWPGLAALAQRLGARPQEASAAELSRRLLLVQCAEAARAAEAGVLRAPRDGDLGAIFGIGFAPNTGGPFSYLDRQGLPAVVAELEALSRSLGERYAPTERLREMAAQGERFY